MGTVALVRYSAPRMALPTRRRRNRKAGRYFRRDAAPGQPVPARAAGRKPTRSSRAWGSPVASVRRMLEQARAQRDVVKTLCLNDKLNQIDVAIALRARSSRRARASRQPQRLRSGEPRVHDPDGAPSARRAARLRRPTSASAKSPGFVGETKVTTTIDHQPADRRSFGVPRESDRQRPLQCASRVK